MPGYYDTIYFDLCNFNHGNPFFPGIFKGNVNTKEPLIHSIYEIKIFGSVIFQIKCYL